MKILIVDNEKIALQGLCNTVENVLPGAEIVAESDAKEALNKAGELIPDIAFLDIRMPGMDGMELPKNIKEHINPKTNIIFTTGYNEYLEEAFTGLRASGYLTKPITKEMILTELDNLRFPVELKGKKRVRVRTFGMFEIFIDDKPVDFRYKKTKELIAFLIDRRRLCTIGELQEYLWEESEDITNHSSYLQNIISDFKHAFKEHGCEKAVIRKYGSVGIDENEIDCDYYEYKDDNPAAINAFDGEYMTQYPWAENTLGLLVFDR